MKWETVDLKKQGYIRIVRRVRWDHFNKRPVLEDVTKAEGAARFLMLPGGLKTILKKMKEESKSDLVFTDTKEGASEI